MGVSSPKNYLFSWSYLLFHGSLTCPSICFYFSANGRSIFSWRPSLKPPLKCSVFPCSLYFQTCGSAASKTLGAGQQQPLSISTPQSTSLIVYESLLLLGCVQKQEKTQESGCAKASRVKRGGGRLRTRGMKGRNSCHSLLVFSRFLKRRLSAVWVKWTARGETQESRGRKRATFLRGRVTYKQTRDAWPQCVTGCSARLQGVPPALWHTIYPSCLFFSEAGLKFNAGHCASL